jgi:hypothetical protein
MSRKKQILEADREREAVFPAVENTTNIIRGLETLV